MSANRYATTTPLPNDAPVPDLEILRTLKNRGTARNFKPDPIPDTWLNALIAAAQHAPTSSNIQAYSIVVVKNLATKTELAKLAGDQKHIIDCPVFFALCADLTRTEMATEMHGQVFEGRTLEKGLVSSIDAALMGMTMSLVADSMGLGNVMIGGMRNKPVEVAKLLKLPPRVYVVFGLCVGFVKSAPLSKPRQSMDAVVHHEFYSDAAREQAIADYNRVLGQYYVERGLKGPAAAWTQPIAEKFGGPRRKNLRENLKELGFDLE